MSVSTKRTTLAATVAAALFLPLASAQAQASAPNTEYDHRLCSRLIGCSGDADRLAVLGAGQGTGRPPGVQRWTSIEP